MPVWKPPHISKVYEALSAIADNRIELISDNEAHVTSTSRGKYYTVTYDPQTSSIMSDDNTAYYTGSISYPMIALLMLKGIIKYDSTLLDPLKNVPWKDINQKLKNDYDKSIEHYLTNIFPQDLDKDAFVAQMSTIYQTVLKLKLNYLGKLQKSSSIY